jgi:NADH-quinone oxidoreductase subunit C
VSFSAQQLQDRVLDLLGSRVVNSTIQYDEVTLDIANTDYQTVGQQLCHHSQLKFDCLIDLCGIDYSTHHAPPVIQGQKKRFAVVVHLLSIHLQVRLRLRIFADDDTYPKILSITGVWPCANWFEREAFDMYGIFFEGHPDLRRILTDYGFVGHPLRKDFPVFGSVEMYYDPDQKRVAYRPVSIEAREITPRIIREQGYGKISP